MSLLSDLLDLQAIDSELKSRNGALGQVEKQLAQSDGLDEDRATLEQIRASVRELETTERDLELKDGELSNHLAEMEKKLYSGRVNNPRELSALNDDVAMLKRQRQDLDERVLLLMEEVEDTRRLSATSEQGLTDRQAAWHEKTQRLKEDRANHRQRIAALEEARKEEISRLAPSTVGQYEATRSKHWPVVAVVERGACTGCRVTVETPLMRAARNHQALTFCTSCNRILYVP